MPRPSIFATLMLLALPALAAEPAKPLAYPDPWELRAQQDMLTLADQEIICEAQTTYLVALEALNDSSIDSLSRPWDYINDSGGSYAIRRAIGNFGNTRVNFLSGINPWQGPYVTYQTGNTWQSGNPVPPGGVDYDQGSPLDPWGTPYYFFSPLGLIRGDIGKVTLELYGDTFGQTTGQYTIVSLGPDGIMSSDDLGYSLGGTGVSVMVLTSLRGAGVSIDTTGTSGTTGKPLASLPNSYESSFRAQAGTKVTLRGQNLGQGTNAKVVFNGNPIDTVTSWTARAITFNLPAELGGQSGTLGIKGSTWSSNALKVTIAAPPPAAAQGWARYE